MHVQFHVYIAVGFTALIHVRGTVIQFLRTYALYGRDRKIAIIILSTASVLFALAVVSFLPCAEGVS